LSSYLKKLAGETVIYGIGAVLPKVVNFLLVASYLTFQIDEDKYGIHGIMYSFVTLALVFFTLRMETTFFKFSSDASYEPKKVFNIAVTVVLGSAGLLMTLMLLFRSSISSALTRPEDSRFVVYFAVILFLDALSSVPFAQLRMTNRPVKFSAIRIVNSLITVGLIVFCFNILPHVSALHWMYDEVYFLDYTFLANLVGSFFVVLMLYK
jgi:O-antigen/teichoic acid export membrane protein